MQVEQFKLAAIKPYWRNPRINDLTVDAVKASIEKYGFNVPLLVDADHVIITGHARYKALMKLGQEEVYCIVSDMDKKKAKEYRIADNKISELSSWDIEALKLEVREIEGLDSLPGFSGTELSIMLEELKVPEIPSVTQADMDQMTGGLEGKYENSSQEQQESYIEITCPHCGEDFSLDAKDVERNIKIQRQQV